MDSGLGLKVFRVEGIQHSMYCFRFGVRGAVLRFLGSGSTIQRFRMQARGLRVWVLRVCGSSSELGELGLGFRILRPRTYSVLRVIVECWGGHRC